MSKRDDKRLYNPFWALGDNEMMAEAARGDVYQYLDGIPRYLSVIARKLVELEAKIDRMEGK